MYRHNWYCTLLTQVALSLRFDKLLYSGLQDSTPDVGRYQTPHQVQAELSGLQWWPVLKKNIPELGKYLSKVPVPRYIVKYTCYELGVKALKPFKTNCNIDERFLSSWKG